MFIDRKVILSLALVGLSSGAALAQEAIPAVENPCVKLRIALDIGSGSTKIRSGIVDACHQKIIAQVAKQNAPVAFKDNLTRKDSDGGFDREFIRQATKTIVDTEEKVRADTLNKLKTDPKYAAYSYLANLPKKSIEMSGVATAAFRQANNTSIFFSAMRDKGINVHKLSQTDEGRVGFVGALAVLGSKSEEEADPTQFISWDIGGASLQIVGYNRDKDPSEPWLDFGNELASNPMRIYVVKEFQKKDPNGKDGKPTTPNPVLKTLDQAEKTRLLDGAEKFVAGQMTSIVQGGWARNASKVYGIGGVHGGVLSLIKAAGNDKATGYSQKDLEGLLDKVLTATDAEIVSKYKVPEAFANATVTNLLMVYSVMKVTGIEEVTVLDVDNTLGELIAPKYWSALDLGRLTDTSKLVNP